jgi:hypothetical protein
MPENEPSSKPEPPRQLARPQPRVVEGAAHPVPELPLGSATGFVGMLARNNAGPGDSQVMETVGKPRHKEEMPEMAREIVRQRPALPATSAAPVTAPTTSPAEPAQVPRFSWVKFAVGLFLLAAAGLVALWILVR